MAQQLYHGFEGKVYKDTVLVAMVTNISVEVNPNVADTRVIGDRTNKEWKAGNLEVTGTIERMWYNWDFVDAVKADTPTEFEIKTTMTDKDGNEKNLTIAGCVFTSWSKEIPSDDMITESVEFAGRSATSS